MAIGSTTLIRNGSMITGMGENLLCSVASGAQHLRHGVAFANNLRARDRGVTIRRTTSAPRPDWRRIRA
jgi:hypothetical protein